VDDHFQGIVHGRVGERDGQKSAIRGDVARAIVISATASRQSEKRQGEKNGSRENVGPKTWEQTHAPIVRVPRRIRGVL